MHALVVRLVLCALLTVNFAWASDVHAPATGSGTGSVIDVSPDHDHHQDVAHNHCLHCYGGNAAQPTVDSRSVGVLLPSATTPLPELSPDRPTARSAAPPERPPRR